MVLVGAVREVQAEDVYASADEFVDRLRVAGRRTESSDDSRLSEGV